MVKKSRFFLVIFLVLVSIGFVSALELNGTTYDVNGNGLNYSNVTVLIQNSSWSQVWYNSTYANASGYFNMTLPDNSSYNYLLSIKHSNASSGAIDYVGQSLPMFPYNEFAMLNNVDFYLKDAGTINITAINSTNDLVQFAYQIKDTTLGYPISESSSGGNSVVAYVPNDRNYSIMIYPAQGSGVNFVPVSFDWNNFSSSSSYSFGLSSYNATIKQVNKQFNVTESFARITGYINGSSFSIYGWDEFTVAPFLLEPGDMIFMSAGTLPYNASAWNQGQSDTYNLSSGFYNISVPYAASETVKYVLYAAAKNSSTFYGSYRNLTVTGATEINFTMYGLLGATDIINMTDGGTGGRYLVNTSKLTFNLLDINNASLSQANAHVETVVDYSGYNALELTFMNDITPSSASSSFSLPLLNVTGIKKINIYSQNYAPKTVSTRTVSQLNTNPNITLRLFNMSTGGIPGESAIATGSISIAMYRSNSSCDPIPAGSCLLTSSSTLATFNPFSVVMGGGKISFRMGVGSVLVHYVNVDLLASGPPDALFESDTGSSDSSSGFAKVLKFGSQGPSIYDYVLVSLPYLEGSTSQTGLNESAPVNISIPIFYDEDWNVAWNASLNGTNASSLAANYSHYSTKQSEWNTLMQSNNCTTNSSLLNATNPCYIDLTNNRTWIRLPHFSGTGPSVTGGLVTAAGSDPGPSSGGSSAGGNNATDFFIVTYAITDYQFEQGYTQKLAERYQARVKINSEYHYVGVVGVTNTTATINVSSTPQQAILSVGQERRFDVTNDSIYDLSVKLNSIESNKADITIKKTTGQVLAEETPAADITGEVVKEQPGLAPEKITEGIFKNVWFWILIAVIIAALAVLFYFAKNKELI